ncbi:unnamed protein product, partial [Coregonus sp. 'balchen']
MDKSEVTTLGLPPSASHGASDASHISVDGAGAVAEVGALAGWAEGSVVVEAQWTRTALEQLQQKILKITEQIRIEQEARDDNVAEYLKLAHNANRHQAFRIKQGLKDVGANVRAGISGFGGGLVEGVKGGASELTHTAVVSKPREFASLIKFGSTDTIEDGVEGHSDNAPLSGCFTLASSPKYGSDDECSSDVSDDECSGARGGGGMLGLGPGRLDGYHHHSSWDAQLVGLQEIKASQAHMEDAIEDMKSQLQSDYSYMKQCLQEERYRYEQLEEQLNDLTELHQKEMSNLKHELASIEEKVAYQSDEITRDSQQQQQQMVQLKGVENANARALLGKLINIILAVMAVVLVFVSTPANFITPLIKTQARGAATVLLALFLF